MKQALLVAESFKDIYNSKSFKYKSNLLPITRLVYGGAKLYVLMRPLNLQASAESGSMSVS